MREEQKTKNLGERITKRKLLAGVSSLALVSSLGSSEPWWNRSVVADDFKKGLDARVWDLRRIRKGRWSTGIVQGKSALGIMIQKGDMAVRSPAGQMTERSEVSEPEELRIPEGTHVSYQFSFLIPEEFPALDNRTVLAQWKQDNDESPPLSLRYRAGQLSFQIVVRDERRVFPLSVSGQIQGVWHSLEVRYVFLKGARGRVQAFLNGVQYVDYEGVLGDPAVDPTLYFKMGIYRDETPESQHLYFADFKRSKGVQDTR